MCLQNVRDQSKQQFGLPVLAAVLTASGAVMMLIGWGVRTDGLVQPGGAIVIAGMLHALFVEKLSGFRFTLWILIANLAALLAPHWFLEVGGWSLTDAWLLLIMVQLIMFGMGTQMSLRDFAQVARMPSGVAIGLSCQFLIMPLVGFALAKLFCFPPEIGAGMVLIGSCSSGLASNVLTFMAKGNLALSVTMTAIATALAPVLTPLWMKLLAGSMVHVDAFQMSLDIIKMVIVPLMAAFVVELLQSARGGVRRVVLACVAISLVWIGFLSLGGWQLLIERFPGEEYAKTRSLLSIPGFIAAAFLFGSLYRAATQIAPLIVRYMPLVSMFGIVYFTLVTTAKGRDQLLVVGIMLLVATALHNLLGYMLGYWGARSLGLNQQDARTVAIEVGTQNGAMATGLARTMDKLETVGLAAMIFAPLMNVTGSIVANYWRRSSR